MKMLLLGFSDLFQRKVAQVWLDSPLIDTVDIATRSRSEQARNFAKLNTLYTDYQQAVTESDADVAYISTTNDLHPHYTELCLSRGMHTLVDKPIMATDAELARIMALAEERRLCVSEVIVWHHHRQIGQVVEILQERKAHIRHIHAMFCFPPIPGDKFQNHQRYGGGSFADQGPYLVSTARFFFGTPPLHARIVQTATVEAGDADAAFSALLEFDQGRTMSAYFGFNAQYTNRLTITADRLQIILDRVYSTPRELANTITVRQGTEEEKIPVAPDDTFANYFAEVLEEIGQEDFWQKNREYYKNSFIFNKLKKSYDSDSPTFSL